MNEDNKGNGRRPPEKSKGADKDPRRRRRSRGRRRRPRKDPKAPGQSTGQSREPSGGNGRGQRPDGSPSDGRPRRQAARSSGDEKPARPPSGPLSDSRRNRNAQAKKDDPQKTDDQKPDAPAPERQKSQARTDRSRRRNDRDGRSQSAGRPQDAKGFRSSRRGRRHGRSKLPHPQKERPLRERPAEPEVLGYEKMSEDQLFFLKSVQIDSDNVADDLPEHDFKQSGTLFDVAGIKLHESGPLIMYDSKDMSVDAGEHVIVETGRGLAYGEVVLATRRQMLSESQLPRLIRRVSANDRRQRERNRDREDAAYRLCKDRIAKFGLPMKLLSVNYLHAGNKAVFYFSADGRVDFRELVRDLSKRLHTRIEMRQIGVRDSTRMLGGIGTCGCRLCCNRYIRNFSPVSIRMAKDQNLVLNPQKVSGICGRLLCCLTYEDEVYREAARKMPKIGRKVSTPDGVGRVKDRDILKGLVRILLLEGETLKEYRADQVGPVDQPNGREDVEENGPELEAEIAFLEETDPPSEL